MKKILFGAAGLLLTTSALAGVNFVKADEAQTLSAAAAVQPKPAAGLDDSMIHNAMLIDWNSKNAAAVETASLDIKAMDEPKLIQAEPAESTAMPEAAESTEPKPTADEAMTTGTMPAETPDLAAPATKPNESGVGGPLETADAGATTLDLSPRPAAQNYPPCAPGPGDDRCIQLYEPGVQTALASWSGQTGGLDNGRTGMGGPEEALDESSAIKASDEEAAYEPLAEDAVMPADEDVALTDSPTKDGTLAI